MSKERFTEGDLIFLERVLNLFLDDQDIRSPLYKHNQEKAVELLDKVRKM